jgi:hypothetical protein
MEALRDFPEEENLVLEFADGAYRSVKTDILKRMMWFAPREAGGDWKGFTVDQVKDYREQNKQGIRPEVVVEKKETKVAVMDFQNDMGTESLTRLDERNKQKKKGKHHKNRNNRNRPNNPNAGQQGNKPARPNPNPNQGKRNPNPNKPQNKG